MQTKIQKITSITSGLHTQIAKQSWLSFQTIGKAIAWNRVEHNTKIEIYIALLKMWIIKQWECNAYTLFE